MVEAVAARLKKVVERPDRLKIAALTRFAQLTNRTIEIKVRLFTGQAMLVMLPDTASTILAYEGDYEPEVTEMMRLMLKPGDTFFDVGAHIGTRSMVACSLGAGKVAAFEPAPDNLRVLGRNCAGLYQVQIVDKAVSDISRLTVSMQIFETRYCGSNTLEEKPRLPESLARNYAKGSVPVKTVTLDDYVASTGMVPDLVKLDVEGHTDRVLRGARATLKAHRPAVIAEVGGYGSEAKEDLEVLMCLGYGFWVWGTGGGLTRDELETNNERNVLAVWKG